MPYRQIRGLKEQKRKSRMSARPGRVGPNTQGKDWTNMMLELLAKQIAMPGFSRKQRGRAR